MLWKGRQFLLHTDTHHVTLVTNRVISHESGKDQIVIPTNSTYPWSFVRKCSLYEQLTFTYVYTNTLFCTEKFEDTKGVIRSRKSKKEGQYNG